MNAWLRATCFFLFALIPLDAFVPVSTGPAFGVTGERVVSSLVLFAKKKKGNNAKTAALEALELIGGVETEISDEPMSLKERKAMLKKSKKKKDPKTLDIDDDDDDDYSPQLSKKEAKARAAKKNGHVNGSSKNSDFDDLLFDDDDEPKRSKKDLKKKLRAEKSGAVDIEPKKPKMSAKEAALEKLLELEALDEASAQPVDDGPKLSKKQLKALKKKQEKQAAKQAAKLAKKEAKKKAAAQEGEIPAVEVQEPVSQAPQEEAPPKKLTLEEKVRKERPPPRVRVMESPQPGFTSLRLEGVGITFRDQQVLNDVTWGVQTGDRIGLVGKNGAGKTTQLRIMAGELEPTTGDVVKSTRNLRVSILRQEFVDELVKERTLKEEFMSVFEEEYGLLDQIREAELELENLDSDSDADKMQEILDKMQDLQNMADAKGVYALESQCQKVMDVMGFTEDEASDLVASFSGGWKMRIGLGKVLLKDPNVLLLDEPTNHLDLESVEWLEAFLREQNIPMVIVSHDREFLDQVCTKIVDAEGGACTEYNGNYSRFLKLKKARMDAWHAAFNAQEKKLKEERKWINKFRVKQPQAVKQREAKLQKFIKSDDYVKKPPFLGKPFRFRFPDAPRLSPEVAEVKHLTHAYNNEAVSNTLFEDVELFIGKGDRISIVGPNGSGKSTLLRFLTGKEQPNEGSARIVGANVVANYFEQNQADALDLDITVVDTVQGASNGQSYNELRALLGQFLFKGDDVEKKVRFLSGGEKARLSLCCMMLRPANLLILDEPTNHLDIPAKEMLEEALQHFAGSVVVVSHDRFFISKVATSIVAIEDKKLAKYQGDYKFYMEMSEAIKAKVEARYVTGVAKIESAPVVDLEAIQKQKGNYGGARTANQVHRKDKGIKNAKRARR